MKMATLGEVCEVLDKKRKPITKRDRVAGPYPYYGATGILDYVEDWIFDERLILLGEDGAKWGRNEQSAFIIDGRTWVNNHAHVLNPRRDVVDDRYLTYYLNHVSLDPFISGTTIPKLTQKSMVNIQIPLPPLDEQKRIAGILDEADRVRKKTQVLIDKYDELAQSLFLDMFGDPVTNPKGWEVKPLGELTSSKPDYGAGAKAIPFEAGLPRYIRITDIDERGDLKKECVASDLDEYDIARYLLKEGDFLFARSGATVGKTFRYSENQGPCVFAGYLIRFQLDPDVMSSKFLSFLCRTEFYAKWVANSSRAVAQPNINAKIFSSLPVIVPPLLEQQKFLSKNEVIEKDLVNARNQMESMIFLFKSLLQKAFKGELT